MGANNEKSLEAYAPRLFVLVFLSYYSFTNFKVLTALADLTVT